MQVSDEATGDGIGKETLLEWEGICEAILDNVIKYSCMALRGSDQQVNRSESVCDEW